MYFVGISLSDITAIPGTIFADGVDKSTISVRLKNETGVAIENETVIFSTTNGSLSSSIGLTDAEGLATVQLTAPLVPGAATVTAQYGLASVSTVVVFVSSTVVGSITLTANPDFIPADGSSSTIITAEVKDGAGAPAPKGTSVTFTTNLGAFPNNASTYTVITSDATGKVSVSLRAGTTAGSAIVTASSNNVTQSVAVTFTSSVAGSISLTATPDTLPANGVSTSNIRATVKDASGNPVKNGEMVSFAIIAGLGTLSQNSSPTASGVANVVYTSPNVGGNVIIRATTVNGVSATVSITLTVPGLGSIAVTAQPTSIPADGSSSSVITATVKDSSGNPAATGTSVLFTTNLGTFSNGTQTITLSTTNASGTISTSLIAGKTGGSAIVVAASGGISQSVVVTFTSNVVARIALTANPSTLFANGKSQSTILAEVTDANGNPVKDGEQISFVITSGLGTLSSSTAGCVGGIAQVTYTSATTAGSVIIQARSVNSVSASTVVVLTSTGVGSITLVANPTSIPADGSSSSTITATLKDSAGNPVTAGTTVTFSTTLGTFSNGGTTIVASTPDGTGVVNVPLIAGFKSGSARVSAAASNGITQVVYVAIGNGVISIALVADPTSIPADGASSSRITATLTGATGNPVTPGTSVTFRTTLGMFSNNQVVYTVQTLDSSGVVSVSLRSSTTPGSALVSAEAGNASQGVSVEFTGGAQEVGSVEISANPAGIPADGTSTSTITATVKTVDNQVIPDVEVTFTTSRGSITSPHTTEANGQAKATLTSARFVDNNVQVTATCQGRSATTIVAFTGVKLTVAASPASLLVGGTTNITATLLDAAVNPIPNAAVVLSADKGTLTQTQTITNALGQVYGTLTSTESGVVTVTASGSGATGTVGVTFTRYLFTVTSEKSSIRTGGETSLITALLLDEGVPKAGQPINFGTTLGTLDFYLMNTDVDGKATVTLTSGSQSGVAVIDAFTDITDVVPPASLSASTEVVITGGAASKIVLTANPDIISTNTGISLITATVYDANDQPAPNQEIYFRINYAPGGGEYLSSSVKVTDAFGVATVNFYAGSLPSALKNVQIEANTASDFSGSFGLVNLTIAGPVANIGIGMNLQTLEPAGGSLKIDIAGIATDVNGNPVADGTKIYFSVTAVEFDEDRANDYTINCSDVSGNPLEPCPPTGTPGFGFTWFSDDVNQDGTMYSLGGPMSTTEDVNHNGILDPGEDKNDNGVIDPIQGCTIDDFVETISGVADATLLYPAPQANNIRVRITAEAGGISNFYETILLCTKPMVDNGTCGIAY